jgi:hypothetical protein
MPLHITKLAQSFPELFLERLRVCEAYVQRAYSSHLSLLRARRERPCNRRAQSVAKNFRRPMWLAM